jgi:hypothetical protein
MSYARGDALVALRVFETLAGAGQNVWLDMRNLQGGDWWDGVRNAIDQSAGVLFLMSEESRRSPACSRELAYAAMRGRAILPIDLEPAMTGNLSALHCANLGV